MFNSSDSVENAVEQDGVPNNTDHFPRSHLSATSNNSSQSNSPAKISTTSALRRWRRKEAQDSGHKNVPSKDPSKEVTSVSPCLTNHDRSRQMNPNAIPSNTFSPGSESVPAGETACPVFVPHLSPLVPQSTARPYEHGITRTFDGSGPRVHPDTGAYSRTSPVTQNKIQIECKVADQPVRYPPGLTQNPYYQSETTNRGRSNGYPIIPNISPGAVAPQTEHRSNHVQQYNTPNPSTTSTPNLKGREYAYQNYVAARSPQELRETSVVANYPTNRGSLDPTKFVPPQNSTEDSYPKGSAFVHDVRIIQPAYSSTSSDRRSELKASANRSSIAYPTEERINIPTQHLFVTNRSGGSNVAAEYANQNPASLNYYQNKPSCVIQDTRTQTPLYPPDRFPNQLNSQNYNHNYLASKTGQLNLQDPKNGVEYRNIVPNTTMLGKYPYPILERRLETGFGSEQALQNYQYQRFGLMPNQIHTSNVAAHSAGMFPQSQKGLQNLQGLPPNYPHSKYYHPNPSTQENRVKDFDQNVHLSQLNQMHSRLPHSASGRSSEMLQNLSYMEQNRHQRNRLYYESQAAMAQKSSKMTNYGLPEQRTPEAIHNEYLEMTRSCGANAKPTDYPRVSNSAVIAKADIVYDPKHSREYVARQEYGIEHNYLNEQPSGYPNNHYGNHVSTKAPEMPPRNISPRRTYQENMPIYVVSPPQASISNPSSGAYGHSDPSNYPNANARNIHTSPIKSDQYPSSSVKYSNIPSNRSIPPLRHFPGYQENFSHHQYYQPQHPNIHGYQDNLLRSQSHYPINLMAVPNANRSYPGFQNEAGNFDVDRLHHPNSQGVSRSVEYSKKSTEMSKSLKEFLESWEDDEEIVANLPDLVLCNNLPPDKHKHASSSSSNSDLEDNTDKSDEKRKANDEAWYIYGRSFIAPEMLQQYLEAFPDKVVDSLPANIKGFYPASSEGPSVDTNVLSTSSNENNDSPSPSPQDLTVNNNFVADEVLNLCTKEKYGHENLNTEEQNNKSVTNFAEKSNSFDDSKSKLKQVDDADNQKEYPEKAVEKPVTASVIVPNTYFEPNRTKSNLEPFKEIAEPFDNKVQKIPDEEDQTSRKNSNTDNSNLSCNEVTIIESQLIHLDKENLETQFDFDTELLSPETERNSSIIEDDKLIPEKAIDISLENMLLSPERIPTFDDTVSISEVLELNEGDQDTSLNEENESDSIRSPSPETTAKYDRLESPSKIKEFNKEETSHRVETTRSSSEELTSHDKAETQKVELHKEKKSTKVHKIFTPYLEEVIHEENLVSPKSEGLIEDSCNSSSVKDTCIVCKETDAVEDINIEILRPPLTKENLEVSEENISSFEGNHEMTPNFVNSPTTVPSEEFKRSTIILQHITEENISEVDCMKRSESKEEVLTSATKINEDIVNDNLLSDGDSENTERAIQAEDKSENKLEDETHEILSLEDDENTASPSFLIKDNENLASISSTTETYENCTTLSENAEIGEIEIKFEDIEISATEEVIEKGVLKDSNAELSNLDSSPNNEEEIVIKEEEDDAYERSTIILELSPNRTTSKDDFDFAHKDEHIEAGKSDVANTQQDSASVTNNVDEKASSSLDDLPGSIDSHISRRSSSHLSTEDMVITEKPTDFTDSVFDNQKEDTLSDFEKVQRITSTLKTKAELKRIILENDNTSIDEYSNYSDTIIVDDFEDDGKVEEPGNKEIETINETQYEKDISASSNESQKQVDRRYEKGNCIKSADDNLSDHTEKLVNEIDRILDDSKKDSTIQSTAEVLVTRTESTKFETGEISPILQSLEEDTYRIFRFDPVMDSLDVTIKEILNNNDTSGFIFSDPTSVDEELSETHKCNYKDKDNNKKIDCSKFDNKEAIFIRLKTNLDPEKIFTEESNIKDTKSSENCTENVALEDNENNKLSELPEQVQKNIENSSIITKEDAVERTVKELNKPEEKIEIEAASNSSLERLENNYNQADFLEKDQAIQQNIKLKIVQKIKSHSKTHSSPKSKKKIGKEKTYGRDKVKKSNVVYALEKEKARKRRHSHCKKSEKSSVLKNDVREFGDTKLKHSGTNKILTEKNGLPNISHEICGNDYSNVSQLIVINDEDDEKILLNDDSSIKTEVNEKKIYKRNKSQKSKTGCSSQTKKHHVDQECEKLTVLSTDICEPDDAKLEHHATSNFLEASGITNIPPKIDADSSSECFIEDNTNVSKVNVLGQEEIHEQDENIFFNEVSSNKTELVPVVQKKKTYRRIISNTSKVVSACEKKKSRKNRHVDRKTRETVTVLSNNICEPDPTKLENNATCNFLEKTFDIPNILPKINADPLSECFNEDNSNVSEFIIHEQEEINEVIVSDEQDKNIFLYENSSNKTEVVPEVDKKKTYGRDKSKKSNAGSTKHRHVERSNKTEVVPEVNKKKTYGRGKSKKSNADSTKNRHVERVKLTVLSTDICEPDNAKSEHHATSPFLEEASDFPIIPPEIDVDPLSECFNEDNSNVTEVNVHEQEEINEATVESDTVRDKDVEKYLLNEDSELIVENDPHKDTKVMESGILSLEKPVFEDVIEEDDEYQHLVTLTDSFDCDEDGDPVIENSSADIVEDTPNHTTEEKSSEDKENPDHLLESRNDKGIKIVRISADSEDMSNEEFENNLIADNEVGMQFQSVEEMSILTLDLVDNEIHLSQPRDEIEIIIPDGIISDDMNLHCLVLCSENDSSILMTESSENNVEGAEIVGDYIGEEVVIGDDGIENDFISEEIVIDEMYNVQDEDTVLEETEEVVREQLDHLVELNNNFIHEEKSHSSRCFEVKTKLTEEFDKDKELFMNPQNPVDVLSCHAPPFDTTDLYRIKRRVSIAGVDSPKIEFIAPKRRYSELELVRSSNKQLINLDEIQQNVSEALETFNKQEHMQYGYHDVPILLGNLDQVYGSINRQMELKSESSYNNKNYSKNDLKNNHLQKSKDFVNSTNNIKSSTISVSAHRNQLNSSKKGFNTSTKSFQLPDAVCPNSEHNIQSKVESLTKSLLPLAKEDSQKILPNPSADESKKSSASLAAEILNKCSSSISVAEPETSLSASKVKVVLPLIIPVTPVITEISNGVETNEQQPEVFKVDFGKTQEAINDKHHITCKFNKDVERIKGNGMKKGKINLEDYRIRKQNMFNGMKKAELAEKKVNEEENVRHNALLLNKHVEHVIDEIEEPKKTVKETNITINDNLTPNNLVYIKNSPKEMKPKRRKRRFRNLDGSEEGSDEGRPSKEARSRLEEPYYNGSGSKESSGNQWNEDSCSCNISSVSGSENGEPQSSEMSCSVDVNANGETMENNCRLKCHIKWNSIHNDDNIIYDYEINKNKNNNFSNLKLTFKTIKRPEIKNDQSDVPGKKKKTCAKVITPKYALDSNNKVPKVIIKRNASGYCAVSRDVSSNPAWQPTISLKRQKFIEALLQKSKKIKQQ